MAINFVNTQYASNSTNELSSISTSEFVATSGNTIIVMTTSQNVTNNPVLSITDTAGNSYSKIGDGIDGSSRPYELWYAKNINGNSSNIITTTFTNSATFLIAHCVQYSGLDTVEPLDNFRFDSGASTSPSSSTSIVANNNDEVIVFMYIAAGSGSSTPDDGFTSRQNISTGYYEILDKIVSSSGNYTGGITGTRTFWGAFLIGMTSTIEKSNTTGISSMTGINTITF